MTFTPCVCASSASDYFVQQPFSIEQDMSDTPPCLPVRLCSDRLSLIEECIAHCPTAYKQSATLLSLASLLRVAGTAAGFSLLLRARESKRLPPGWVCGGETER